MVNANIISIERAKALGVIITGRKEFIYDYCKDCIHHSFAVALGLHHQYGWYIQLCDCKLGKCSPQYEIQLKLFDYA